MKTFHLLTITVAGVNFGAWAGELSILLEKQRELRLVQEPENFYDQYAIRVDTIHNAHGLSYKKLGYVPAVGAAHGILNRLLSAGYELTGKLSDNSDERQLFVHVHMKVHNT